MCSQGKTHIFTILFAIAASQLSLRYLYDPVQVTPTSYLPVTGWVQLSVLLQQGKTGCLCCDDGVTLLPEAKKNIKIFSWKPKDYDKIKNVTIPGEINQKTTKQLYEIIYVVGSEPGENGLRKSTTIEGKDAFCVQACIQRSGFFF